MTLVGSSWVEIEWWGDSTGYSDYQARWRVLARSTQDISSNSSTVYFKLQKRVTGGSAYNYNTLEFTITGTGANGDGHSASQDWTYGNVSSTTWTDVGGDTSDMYWSGVKHRNDGTLSLTATAVGDRVLTNTDFDTDISITLPTIARASIPTVAPNPIKLSSAFNTLTVTTNRKSSSFTHKITCTIGSFTDEQTGITDSTTFELPQTLLGEFQQTSKTLQGTIVCETYNGVVLIGSKEISFTASIDTDIEYPIVSSITVEDLNTKASAIEAQGSLIQFASNMKATISLGVVGNYTNLDSATVQCGTRMQTYSLSGTSQTIVFEYDKIDANVMSVYVTDKRGTTNGSSKSWTLIPYVDLTAVGEIRRVTETGNTIHFKVSGQCFAGNFGQATNQITVKYKSKLYSDSDYPSNWTTINTFTPSGDGVTTYEFTNGGGVLSGFDYDKQYNIIFYVEDLFTTATTIELVITTGIPVYGNGPDFFAVYGNLYIHDRTNPTEFWTLNPSEDIHDEIDEVSNSVTAINSYLEMHNYNWSSSWSNGGSVSRVFQINGKGLVIINAYVQASTTSDTGQCAAHINLYNSSNADQGLLASSANRVSESSEHRISANAATQYYFDGESNINRLRCYLYCTKNGTNTWRIQVTTIGCTVTAL